MSNRENEELLYQLQDWLKDRGFSLDDVHSDERGYFVLNAIEVGNPAEDSVDVKRLYLPANFQSLCL